MIGYYVHHVGRGHVQRAQAVAAHLPGPLTGLSSLPRPSGWAGEWVVLSSDDDDDRTRDATAGGVLHWAPLGHAGLRGRMGVLAGWIASHAPDLFVADVSVEVTVLARLLGVPVVTVALPGDRTDAAHQLGFSVARAILAPWPDLGPGMCTGLEPHRAKVHHVGGLSRFDGRVPTRDRRAAGTRVLALGGAGGAGRRRRPRLPADWCWTERGPGHWSDDVWPDLCAADVVVTHCGIGALSDVAAARKPAVLVPERRPHGEQAHTARAMAGAGLGLVLDGEPAEDDWPRVLADARRADPGRWSIWSAGDAAPRFADILLDVARNKA